ncbi:MAG: Crp/Fnr family transcriptional regulator [Chromatiales bacterium]|jgi:hypothetical protein
MLLPNSMPGPAQRRLLKLFAELDEAGRQHLLVYAEFLLSRQNNDNADVEPVAESLPEPEPMERPQSETVIGAIKRLSKSYSMLNKDAILHETSDLMSAHVLKGRPAVEVIDELEVLFERHYLKMKQADDTDNNNA